jgi:hypothetical protein
MKRQFLMPSALGIALMLCLLMVQALSLKVISHSALGYDYSYGFPTIFRISETDIYDAEGGITSVRSVHVYWKQVVASFIVSWCLGMPIGRWITGYEKRNGEFVGPLRTGWSQPAAIVGYVVGLCGMASAITSAILDRVIGSPVSLAEMIFGFFVLLMMLAVPTTVIVLVVRRWRHRTRVAQRGFAVEMRAAQV